MLVRMTCRNVMHLGQHLPLLARLENGTATLGASAQTAVGRLVLVGGRLVAGVCVVVEDLLSPAHRAQSLDEDASSIIDGFAVWGARVIDETRVVPVHRAIDHRASGHPEQKGVVTAHPGVVIASVGLLPRNTLAYVLGDAFGLGDVACGVHPLTLHSGAPNDKRLRRRHNFLPHA